MEHIHINKDGKFTPLTDAEYFTIMYFLYPNLFAYEYGNKETKQYIDLLTQQEKDFLITKRKELENA